MSCSKAEEPDIICPVIERKVFAFSVSSDFKNCTTDKDCKFVNSRVLEQQNCSTFLLGQNSQDLINLERVHKMYCPARTSKNECKSEFDEMAKRNNTVITVKAFCEYNQCVEKAVAENPYGS